MNFKYYLSLFLLNYYVVFGFGFFQPLNVFYQLNKKIDDIVNTSAISENSVNTRWIEQKLDHFNSRDERTWKMRYVENLSLWKANGPIYLFMCGESEMSPSWALGGLAYELARETSGALYVSEHRYYGKSKPFNSNTAENLMFLTERQALADTAYFLKNLKQQPHYRNSKVVVIGGSYPGNLAAWMRSLYPELVDAAVSSSAPVLAKKDFYEYIEKVNDNYAMYGTKGCIDRIKDKFRRYEKLLQSAQGIKQLKKEENICDSCDFTVQENQELFFFTKVSKFLFNSQYGNLAEIRKHCNNLDDDSFPHVGDEPFLWYEPANCFILDFKSYINQYRQIGNEHQFSWAYQTCTAFGYFQTANSKKQPFTNNLSLDFYIKTCQALYGPAFNERRVDEGIRRVNNMYGGRSPNVTNVVFTNGGLDPWSNLGIMKDISNKAPALVMPHSAHCQDLLSDSRSNDEQLKKVVKQIKYLIKSWIGVKS